MIDAKSALDGYNNMYYNNKGKVPTLEKELELVGNLADDMEEVLANVIEYLEGKDG